MYNVTKEDNLAETVRTSGRASSDGSELGTAQL